MKKSYTNYLGVKNYAKKLIIFTQLKKNYFSFYVKNFNKLQT